MPVASFAFPGVRTTVRRAKQTPGVRPIINTTAQTCIYRQWWGCL
jgi:hypothetical protein